jgi:hypothetical protein
MLKHHTKGTGWGDRTYELFLRVANPGCHCFQRTRGNGVKKDVPDTACGMSLGRISSGQVELS